MIGCMSCKQKAARTRGVCDTCCARFRRQIKAGKTTWEELEKQGKCRATTPPRDRWTTIWGGRKTKVSV